MANYNEPCNCDQALVLTNAIKQALRHLGGGAVIVRQILSSALNTYAPAPGVVVHVFKSGSARITDTHGNLLEVARTKDAALTWLSQVHPDAAVTIWHEAPQ